MNPSPSRSPVDTLLSGLTWLLAAPLLGLALLHGLAGDGVMGLVWLHAASPWLLLPALPLLGLSLARRKPKQIAVTGATTLLWLGFNHPPLPTSVEEGRMFKLANANALMVNPTPDRLVAELLESDADVLLFQEFTPEFQAEMARQGSYPFKREHPEHHSFGLGLYSKHPIVSETLVKIGGVDLQQAVIRFDGTEVAVWNVHTRPPFTASHHAAWLGQIATIASMAERHEGPLIVAGDFNMTRHHAGYARLTEPLTDAYRECGRWVAATWPAHEALPLPKIKLDHVFLSGGVHCHRIREGVGEGSDHRPILAELIL